MEGMLEVVGMRHAGGLSCARECPQPFVLHAHHLQKCEHINKSFYLLK